MANYFATTSQWAGNSTVYPAGNYLYYVPDGFVGTSGSFRFKVTDGARTASQLPFAPNSSQVVIPSNTPAIPDPLPVTSTDLNLEATQLQVLGQLSLFQFDGVGALIVTGGGGGGGDATAANQVIGNASLASIDGKLTAPLAVTGPLTDVQLRAAPVPVSAAALPLPTGASTEATLSTLTGKVPANLTVTATRLLVDGSGVTQPVSGPLTDAELRATPVPVSGTVTATGGLTDAELRATPVPVSAAALPLPTGAATAALQTQPGVDIGDVTVNNAAGASAVNVQDGGNSLTVDGIVTVTPPTLTKGTQGATGFSVQPLRDAGRTTMNFYTNGGVVAAATATEAAITLTISSGTSATATGVSFTPTNGKTFRIISITLRSQGNSVATAATTVFSLRMNTAGAVITTSTPILQRWALATPATALAVDRITMNFPEGLDLFGDGTMQWGLTAQSGYVTNAPTWHANITGYEF